MGRAIFCFFAVVSLDDYNHIFYNLGLDVNINVGIKQEQLRDTHCLKFVRNIHET